jgi:hypothetical protein
MGAILKQYCYGLMRALGVRHGSMSFRNSSSRIVIMNAACNNECRIVHCWPRGRPISQVIKAGRRSFKHSRHVLQHHAPYRCDHAP